jgi:thioredoxin 1
MEGRRALYRETHEREAVMAVEASEATFDSEVIGSEGKVIVDFWAEWCGPCHAVAPVLDRIADEHQVKLVKVNIDQEQGLAQRFGVSSIPTMMLFEGGELRASAIGALPKGALERALGLAADDEQRAAAG